MNNNIEKTINEKLKAGESLTNAENKYMMDKEHARAKIEGAVV